MEGRDIPGFWWLPQHSDDMVAGITHWEPDSAGLTLDLFGDFGGRGHSDQEYPVIFGLSNEPPQEITLLGSQQTGIQVGYPGYSSERYHSAMAVLGAHLGVEGEPLFTDARAEIGYLPDWSKFTGISELKTDRVHFAYGLPSPIECTLLDDTTISLASSVSVSSSTGERRLVEHVTLGRRYPVPKPLQHLLKGLGILQDLLTFATNRPNILSRIQVVSSDASDDKRPLDLLLTMVSKSEPRSGENKPLRGIDMLFTLEESPGGFSQLMNRWHKMYDSIATPLHLLFSVSYAPFMYVGTRFLHLAQAAEIYHRLRFGGQQLPKPEHRSRLDAVTSSAPASLQPWLKQALQFSNELSLADRLQGLLSYVSPALEPMIENSNRFVAVVRDTRNYLTHNGKKRKALDDPQDLHRLGDGVAWLLKACIIQELGFSKEDVSRLLTRNRSFLFDCGHLPAAAGGRCP